VRRITASSRVPHAERAGGEAGGDHAVMTMLVPTPGADEVVAEIHSPREVTLSLQFKLLVQMKLLADIRFLPLLKILGLRQPLLMDAADLVEIHVLQSQLSLQFR
jgi:hypothetical protein